MGERQAYVKIGFKDGSTLLFQLQGASGAAGTEFIRACGEVPLFKLPGWRRCEHSENTEASVLLVPTTEALEAYEVLLGAAIKGDQSLFVTFREIVAAYKVWDAVLKFRPINEKAKYLLGTPLAN